ncbi:hypothetical protein B0H11DRAFT_2199004 [Mycena galericulata]|nr:hypothetical protein B0H11DRAFT_2199004 [Mycena galericulata]
MHWGPSVGHLVSFPPLSFSVLTQSQRQLPDWRRRALHPVYPRFYQIDIYRRLMHGRPDGSAARTHATLPRLRAGWVLPSAPEAAHRMDASVSPRGRSQDGCFRQLPRLLAGWVRCIHQVPRLRTGWVLPLAPEAARRMGAFVGSLGCAQDGCVPQLAGEHTGYFHLERVQVERKLG